MPQWKSAVNPDLRGRPIVVGADPKAGAGRGVVTTASYAARKYGIRSAMPITRAWRLAEAARRRGEPEAVFLRGDRAVYREVSDRIMAIVARGADAFEEASIDEAYLDLSSLGDFERAGRHARAVKAEVVEREGLTCSIGHRAEQARRQDRLGLPEARRADDRATGGGPGVPRPAPDPADSGHRPEERGGPARAGHPDDRRTARRRADAARGVVRQVGDGDGRAGTRRSPTTPCPNEWERKSAGEQETFEQDTLEPSVVLARAQALAARRLRAPAGRRIRRLPHGHGHRPVLELRHPEPLPDRRDPPRRPRPRWRRSRTSCCCRSSTSGRTRGAGRSA